MGALVICFFGGLNDVPEKIAKECQRLCLLKKRFLLPKKKFFIRIVCIIHIKERAMYQTPLGSVTQFDLYIVFSQQMQLLFLIL